MGTTWDDVAHDLWLARMRREEEERARHRDRSHEASEFVAASVTHWLTASGATIMRVHPQEMFAGGTPIGLGVRIRVQAARTPVASSIQRMLLRESRDDPRLRGHVLAVALPDLPRLRRACAELVADLPPERPITWLFVSRYGEVEVVAPPRESDGAAQPSGDGQSSMRSGTTA